MKADEVRIRAITAEDLEPLADFRCSSGKPWEDLVERQIQGPLPRRYLAAPPCFDGRMLLGEGAKGDLLVVGAHHIEPTLEPDVGSVEVIAVSSSARGAARFPSEDRRGSLADFYLTPPWSHDGAGSTVREDRRPSEDQAADACGPSRAGSTMAISSTPCSPSSSPKR